jgi:S1-C subfamily serine protease
MIKLFLALVVTVTVVLILAIMPTLAIPPFDSCVLVTNANGGHGSGVVVGPYAILTAKHVSVCQGLSIRTESGQVHDVVYVIPGEGDAALLIVDANLPPPLVLSTTPMVRGDDVIAIGAPFNRSMQNSVLFGHVVNVDQEIDYSLGLTKNLDIVDVHGGPGCSGGAVIHDGRVVGIMVGGYDGLGIVIPAENLKELLEQWQRP